MAMYAEAAQLYAEFAERYPDELGEACTAEARANGVCPDATMALENAIFFHLGLRDRPATEAAAALYARNYGARRPEQTASIAFAMRRGLDDPEAIATHAELFLSTYDATAHLHERAMALVALARARIAQGRPDDASAALARVIAPVTPEALASLDGTEIERAVHGARARDALAEARFLSAEQRPVVIARPPRYAGPRTEAGGRGCA